MQHLRKTGGGGANLHPMLGTAKEPVAHLFLFSTTYTLFQVPYLVSPLFATLTKTAGCVPTIPILERVHPGATHQEVVRRRHPHPQPPTVGSAQAIRPPANSPFSVSRFPPDPRTALR